MKWINPKSATPERIVEHWCMEDTAQEVLIQYLRSRRVCFCVGWFENGRWWCDDEPITYDVICWTYIMSDKICYQCLGIRNKVKCNVCNGTGKFK